MVGDPVVGEALQRGDRHLGAPPAVPDAAGEGLLEVGQPLAERAQPLPGLVVAVDAGPPEVEQGLLQHPGAAVVEAVGRDGDQRGVHLRVEHQVGAELLGLHHVALGLLAQAGVRVHLRHQVRGVHTVGELDAEPVPDLQGIGGTADQLGAELRGAGQGALAARGQPGGPVAVEVGQGQRHQRRHLRRLPTSTMPAMSTHIGAEPGAIAPHVLMPGDPLRAKWIAETFLEDATCYNEVRGMLGYTGTWQGQRVCVQGSGMGQPSFAIYANELFDDYDVQSVVRVGSCGALVEKVGVRDVILASGACTDSGDEPAALPRPRLRAGGRLRPAAGGVRRGAGPRRRHRVDVGLIFSGDQFYTPRPELMAPMVEHGVLAVEMEASALYTLAAKYDRKALAICTVSDHIVTGEETTAQERQQTFSAMVEIALAASLGA